MAASRQDIERWLYAAKLQSATHLIVVCDEFDWDDFGVPIYPGQDPRYIAGLYNSKNMHHVVKVYNLSMPLDAQSNELRVMNF